MRKILDQKHLAETLSVPPPMPVAAIDGWIENLRTIYPPLLTISQYCAIKNCCPAAAYIEFKRHRGLALKSGRSTRVVRDVALELLARLPPWLPEKERGSAAAALAKPRRERPKRVTAAPAPTATVLARRPGGE
jgi:hypothetical protein